MAKINMYAHSVEKEGTEKLATRYSSDYDNYRRVEPGISRDSGARRPEPRGSSAGRSSAGRGYSGGRPSSGSRQPQRSGGRPPQRPSGGARRTGGGRRRPPSRMPAVIAALAVVAIIALVLVIVKPFGKSRPDPVPGTPVAPASNPVDVSQGTLPEISQGVEETAPQYDNLADKLADANNEVGSLSAEQMATVTDLRMNTNLPTDWLNVLLLGTDERILNDSARTDAMMIASINRTTGEVKLTSILRDLAIEFTDIGEYNGTYRINAANFFGGPNLAMRTVNEKFGMNIQYYVIVNFYGFQRIAQRLGGIDIDITEDEMNQINKWAYNVYKNANKAGVDISDVEWAKLETYGENVHLNGTQTLAYARIRKLEGGDYMRAQRQRTVLGKLLEKAKKLDAIQLAALANEMLKDVKTNLPVEDMFPIAVQVCANGLSNMETMQLPMSGTYKEEVRNEHAMLYDCDFATNSVQLYNFIYE